MQTIVERIKYIKRRGIPLKLGEDFYHSLLVMSWLKFFVFYVVFFIVFNLAFSLLYFMCPGALEGTNHSLWHYFVFSVQTFSTVGYGVFAPKTDWAHSIVIFESILAVFVTALLTGLIFAKFSRPSAKIIFSKNILINKFDGKTMLTFRMGNLRANQIVEAQVRIVALITHKTSEGQTIRRQIDLKLERDLSLFFALTWTILHKIDESSPLYGYDKNTFLQDDVELSVSVVGYDSTFAQTVHSNIIYSAQDIIFDRYFEDVLEIGDDGKITAIDYNKFDLLKV